MRELEPNVGGIAASTMARQGIKIIAVSDAFGGLYNPKGIDLAKLDEHVAKTRSVVGFGGGSPLDSAKAIAVDSESMLASSVARPYPNLRYFR